MSAPRIVFTGHGAVCAAGATVEQIWDALQAGRSALAPLRRYDIHDWPARLAGEVTVVDERGLVADRKLHKMVWRTDLLGLYAAGQAIAHACLPAERDAAYNDRTGVFVGSGGGSYQINHVFFPVLTTAAGSLPVFGREFSASVKPMWLLRTLPNNVVCHVGIRHGFKGPNACITNHCVGGVMAVAEAAATIRQGDADRALAAGHDNPLDPETIFHYHELGLLDPAAIRPFDRDRQGTILGEGAAAVLLETAADARARGATILGEFLGAGCVTEASGIVDVRPDGDGLVRAVQLALAEAGLQPRDVGCIIAHGNGTRASDASEAAAIHRLFGADTPPVTAFKWAFGHTLAAAGILDLVLALHALRHRRLPGLATLRVPEFPLPVTTAEQTPRAPVALLLCRGFGGMNTALLVRAP